MWWKGKIKKVVRSIFGSIEQTHVCDDCEGEGHIHGEKCNICRGGGAVNKKEEIVINVPKGVINGNTLK